jgi:hypothetical protein
MLRGALPRCLRDDIEEDAMTCEEFERTRWDAERDASLTADERAAAIEHAAQCSRCAALEDSWHLAKAELRALAGATEAAETPSRVEMRLRLEFRTRHRSMRARRAAAVLAWTLAAAAAIAVAVVWINWRHSSRELQPAMAGSRPAPAKESPQDGSAGASTLVADGSPVNFTLLPGSTLSDTDAASVVRVRMQRSSLGALGLPVAEDRAADWIQVDLLVTDDGLPQAVRVPD